jgi:hypothetical protein
MKLLMENWRKYLNESLEGFSYLSASPWSTSDAKQEWGEEVSTSIENGDDYIAQRWPGLSREVIEEKYPFLLSAEDFAKTLNSAPIQNLSLSQMKNIHNHAQVYDIIEMYENGSSSEEVQKAMYSFFKGTGVKSDPDASGKSYTKESSYQRWVDMFKESDSIDKPSVVLELPDGGLAHVSGQTRQTGALTNRKIVPYAVLKPTKGEQDETPT